MSPEEASQTGALLVQLTQSNLEPTDEAVDVISERVGFGVQRRAAQPAQQFGNPNFQPSTFSAIVPKISHPSDKIAMQRAKVLGEAYRGAMAPFRNIILSSSSREECLAKLSAAYTEWSDERLASELETALQLCAAAGAADAKTK
jgi:phage gp29-like protein